MTFMSLLLTNIDASLFHFINQIGQNSFFDWFMPFITDLNNFFYVLILLGFVILWKDRKAGVIFLIFIGITLTITDQFSSHFLKNWVGRVRPCHILENVRLLVDCNSSFSFPSSHAVNIFAAAFFLSQPFKKYSIPIYILAALVGYSRIYIGIHYPLDVIGGAGIGLIIAWPLRWMKDQVVKRWLFGKKIPGAYP
jgi:undecaprenyl-diphosphatase